MSKKDRRKQAAEVLRRQQAARQRRRSWLIAGAVAGIALLIGALATVAIVANQDDYDVVQPEAAHTDDAIVLGDGPVTVDVYIDYMCPVCNQFEQAVGDSLDQYLSDGAITVNYHPVAYLNRYSEGTEFSSRAAAAAVSAADAGLFQEFTDAMFAKQPPENSPGLTDDEIIDIGRSVGLGDAFAADVREQTYRGWIEDLTTEASSSGVTGTPTAMINGETVSNAEFLDRLDTAVSAG